MKKLVVCAVVATFINLVGTVTVEAADPADQVDLLVVYTPDALAAAGDLAALEGQVDAAIGQWNLAAANSSSTDVVVPQVNRVGLEVAAYSGTGSMLQDLWWLEADPDVAALRNLNAADIVVMVVDIANDEFLTNHMATPDPAHESEAFGIVKRGALPDWVMTKVVGHIMGLDYEPEWGVFWGSAYPWAFAHWVDGAFRTVMATGWSCTMGCPIIPYFSTPDLSYGGHPLGLENFRDNVRVANDTAPIVANFRQRPSIFSDGFEGGDTSDWSSAVGGV